MNTVTKVFIVINLILAIVLSITVAVMYAYRENYKRRWDKDTTELREDIKNLRDQSLEYSFKATKSEVALQNTRTQLRDSTADNKRLRTESQNLRAEIAAKDTEINELRVLFQKEHEANQQLQQELAIANKRKEELNKIAQVSRAVAFELNVKLAEVEDDYNNALAELERRERVIADLEQHNKTKAAMLAVVRDHHPRIWDEINSDRPTVDQIIRGVVAAVRRNPQGQQDLVMLTVGADEGVQEGMEFIIYRSNQYVVKVRAERVMGDMVACRVIPDTWNTRGVEIKQGDLAQNRLF